MAFRPFRQFDSEHSPTTTCSLTGGRISLLKHSAECASEIKISIREQTT